MSAPDLRILILAAGSARRFGSDKRRKRLYGSTKLLQATVEAYLDSGFSTTLLLSTRSDDDDLAEFFAAYPVQIFRCRNAEQGMGATLAEAVAKYRETEAVAVALGDMPLIQGTTIRELAARLRPGTIVHPLYRSRRGHPVFFSSKFFPELMRLGGDRGAASILEAHQDACIAVSVDDPGVCQDVDTPEALEELRRVYASRSSSGVSG